MVNDEDIDYPKRVKITQAELNSLPEFSPERQKVLWNIRLRRVDRRVLGCTCLTSRPSTTSDGINRRLEGVL